MGTHIGVGTFGSVTLMYWFYCRLVDHNNNFTSKKNFYIFLVQFVKNTMVETEDIGLATSGGCTSEHNV